ncbi:unnamed protein product [Rotaria socialis]|uniref:Coiled-coil domain-containing protein 81 n=3 Tax=Rotaria socialis TaxID=392032 RepID=A0A821LVR9_9BILA|nr:unnamed protein product [Rotaria socialis]CAF4426914.1 unnamed protein product [Rotaria socialis]CAF4614636.1 unnamed protein product [Rotaria socialis]CAF4757285.1 unnamed protein product [Rotaria socialis]
MIDNINKLSKNLDRNKQPQQQTAASIVNLTDDDVVKIWDAVSTYIENYMKQSKGVAIPGFGTFSFIHKRIDIGNNKYILIQRPIFDFSEKFAQTHGLKFTHYPVNGSIPVHPLNYFYIQTQSSYTRDQIEQCVKHVLQVFNRSVAAQRNVEFTFSRIGKLQIRDGKVKMRFFKDFVNAVDGNGGNAGKYLFDNSCNRPQTSDSVMSEREAARPPTASNVVLPRLNSRIGNPSMHAIQEEDNGDNDEQQNHCAASSVKRTQQRDPSSCKNDFSRSCSRGVDVRFPPLVETPREPTVPTTTTQQSPNVVTTVGLSSTQDGIVPIASLFSSLDLGQPPATPKKTVAAPLVPMRRTVSCCQPEAEKELIMANQSNGTVLRATNETSAALGFTRPATDRSARDRISSSLNVFPQQYQTMNSPSSSSSKPTTSCGHHGAGQELCYLCHQRAKRNIPIYLHDEKRIREAEDAKLLEQYQHDRDLDEHKKREMALKADREEKQRIAAYNLGIAEATRVKKMERPKTSDVPRSFVFRKRVQTPPTYVRQQDLAKQLEAQIKWKHDEDHAEKQDKNFVERLEQIQLAEALAQEREAYLRSKRLHQEEMKSALDNQVRNKPNGIPPVEIATAYFGVNDMTTDKLQERRLQAMEVFRQQKEVVEQRQRQQLLKQIREQEYESRALDAMKDDFISDRRDRFRRSYAIRKDLETDWSGALDMKRKRDDDERAHVYAPQGVLVHEQCDQYKRCAQCQRNINNYGNSNIWKDTRYIPGTRIMV